MEKFRDNLSKIVLVFTSSVAILIGSLDLFFDLEKIKFLKETPQITLLLLGSVSLWIGLEQEANFAQIGRKIDRANRFDEMAGKIDDLHELIRFGLNAQYLTTSLETLKASERIVKEAQLQIYILSFDLGQTDVVPSPEIKDAFLDYFNAVKSTVKQQQDIDFRIVYSNESSRLSQQASNIVQSVKEEFIKFGAIKARFAWKQVPVGFYLLIVDDKHLLIGFPFTQQDAAPSNVIKITNNVELIRKISKWYEEFIWNNSTVI